MPALMSDVLAFRQQSLLQQQQQQQEELLQRYQPIRSIFHALDPLSVMATAERNRAHGIRNEDVVSRRMGDTSDHQSGDLHPFETAIINNSRTTQVLRTMRGSNVLHKLPSDIARLAISFL
jgi:guanylate kinase